MQGFMSLHLFYENYGKLLKQSMSKIIDFFRGQGKTDEDVDMVRILDWDDMLWEFDHSYIQWVS